MQRDRPRIAVRFGHGTLQQVQKRRHRRPRLSLSDGPALRLERDPGPSGEKRGHQALEQ